MIQETFGALLRDRAHWEFELFLMLIFDGLLAGLLIPFGHKHWKRHIACEQEERINPFAGSLNWSLTHPDHQPKPLTTCFGTKTSTGWYCTREIDHGGPCAARPFAENPAKNHDGIQT